LAVDELRMTSGLQTFNFDDTTTGRRRIEVQNFGNAHRVLAAADRRQDRPTTSQAKLATRSRVARR